MANFPRIESPCPYGGELSAIMEGAVCCVCHRQVHDLNALSNQERVAFLSTHKEEICVSYKFPLSRAIAAAMTIAVLAIPVAAAAQDVDEVEPITVVGGIKDPSQAESVSDEDSAVPELPVVFEDRVSAQPHAAPAHGAPAEGASIAGSRADLGDTLPAQ